MKKIFWLVPLVGLCLMAMTAVMTSCGGGDPLEKTVREAFVKGDTTQARYNRIVDLLKSNPKKYSDYIDGQGNVNVDALSSYINAIGQKLRPPMSWNVKAYAAQPLSLTVYFERSGSMVPYDSQGGSGQLKKAVNDLINYFPGKERVSINIVNDGIYPYRGTVDSFLQDRNIYATTQGTGNPAYTDFKVIFDKIFQAQKPNNVSILVTDLIYSPRNTAGVSTAKIFNEENSLATSIFKHYKGKSVIVEQLLGDFDGMYYPYSGVPFQYKGPRPFYIIIVADASLIDRMAADKSYANFLNLGNVLNSYRFNQAQTELKFNMLPSWRGNAGRFRPDRDDAALLTHCQGDKLTGVLAFSIAVNLDALQKNDVFLTNAANYAVQSHSGFTVKVERITPNDVTGNNRRFLEGMTHVITFTGKFNTPADEIVVNLRNDFPQWITSSTSNDDSNPAAGDFAHTTFGLERFLRGIYDAFSAGGSNSYATIHIRLEK
ncbi:MAG: hypothetical protein MR678_00630 [Muribaculaceae bacterium]|nr:hypothetical protein [Muribaculaceae bacterium]